MGDRGTRRAGKFDGGFFKAQCPVGYVAISDVAVWNSNSSREPTEEVKKYFKCVSVRAANQLNVSLIPREEIWSDRGSGAKANVVLSKLTTLFGVFNFFSARQVPSW